MVCLDDKPFFYIYSQAKTIGEEIWIFWEIFLATLPVFAPQYAFYRKQSAQFVRTMLTDCRF